MERLFVRSSLILSRQYSKHCRIFFPQNGKIHSRETVAESARVHKKRTEFPVGDAALIATLSKAPASQLDPRYDQALADAAELCER